MKLTLPSLFLALLLPLCGAPAGKPVDINLATILPAGTSGHQRLMEMRDAWTKSSTGGVKLAIRVGTGDGEQQIVRQLRTGRYQAALISAVGLSEIDRSVTCLQHMPMTFRDWSEVDFVREKLRGELEGRLREKGFEVLFWADAGWVRFFSKTPAVHPDEFKPLKMFVWTGEPHQLDVMRSLGYQPVGLETEQILPSLSTGMINTIPVPPFIAAAGQYNRYLSHMVDVNWVPIVGAAIVRREVWEKIPAELRPALKAAAATTGEAFRAKTRAEDDAAIVALKERGLTVHAVTPEITAAWHVLAGKIYPQIRGSIVPAELFDRVQGYVAEFRAAHAAPAK